MNLNIVRERNTDNIFNKDLWGLGLQKIGLYNRLFDFDDLYHVNENIIKNSFFDFLTGKGIHFQNLQTAWDKHQSRRPDIFFPDPSEGINIPFDGDIKRHYGYDNFGFKFGNNIINTRDDFDLNLGILTEHNIESNDKPSDNIEEKTTEGLDQIISDFSDDEVLSESSDHGNEASGVIDDEDMENILNEPSSKPSTPEASPEIPVEPSPKPKTPTPPPKTPTPPPKTPESSPVPSIHSDTTVEEDDIDLTNEDEENKKKRVDDEDDIDLTNEDEENKKKREEEEDKKEKDKKEPSPSPSDKSDVTGYDTDDDKKEKEKENKKENEKEKEKKKKKKIKKKRKMILNH